MTSTSLRQRLLGLFVVAGVVTVVLVALVLNALVRLDAATDDRVRRFGPALLETETLARAYSDQEAGLREYLVGGRADLLSSYEEGRVLETETLAELEQLLAGRPRLLGRLDTVRASAALWHERVAEPAIEQVAEDGAAALTPAEVASTGDEFGAVRASLGELRRPLRELRAVSGVTLESTQKTVREVLLVALGGLVALAFLTWQALRRWVTEPLRDLGGEVDRVEAGDMSQRVAVADAPREIADLAEQVERMRMRVLHEYAIAELSREEALAARATVEEQAEDLRRSNAELEQFAYVASHDLQEPLRKVASFCQLLERRYSGQLDERGEQYIEYAVDGAKRMQQLINDLLAFSRVGRAAVELEPVDLEATLEQALRQLAAAVEDSHAVVTHDPLPAVCGDASLLVQLLQNLVGNAVKFRSDEAPRVHLGVARMDEDMVEISCRDNGIGIEDAYRDKIFVIFQRLHSRDTYAGTGIGLAMCKKIVEHHGGRLWLDTTGPGDGSTFRFTLPLTSSSKESRHEPA